MISALRSSEVKSAALVLLRHGESTANAAGRFAGQWDVGLTEHGVAQANAAANLLLDHGFIPAVLLTSPLQRASRTAELIRVGTRRTPDVLLRCPELTERAYGALTGRRKAEISRVFGSELTQCWRRSLTGLPPAGSAVDPLLWDPVDALSPDAQAAAEHRESLLEVIDRVRSWYDRALQPRLAAGQRVLVVAHGNSLRALVALLDGLDAVEVEALNIPTGHPMRYTVSRAGVPIPRSCRYLDPKTAGPATVALRREGGT